MQCVGTENVFAHGMLYKEFCKIYDKALQDFNESYPIRCFPSPSYAYICFLTPLHIGVYSGKRRRFLLGKCFLPSSKIQECGYHSCDAVWASNSSAIYVRSSTGLYIYVYSFTRKTVDFGKKKVKEALISYANFSINKLFFDCSLNNEKKTDSPLSLVNDSDDSSLSDETPSLKNEQNSNEYNLSSPALLHTFLRQSTNARIDYAVPHTKRVLPLWQGAQKETLEKDSIISKESKKTLQLLEGFKLNLSSILQCSDAISHFQLAYENLIILSNQNFLLQVYSLNSFKTPLVRLNLHSLITETSENESWLIRKDEALNQDFSSDSPYFTQKLYHPESITNCVFECGLQKTSSSLPYQIQYIELNETLNLIAVVFCTGAAAILAWKTSLKNLFFLPKITKTQKNESNSKSFGSRCIGIILRQWCVMTVRFNTMKRLLAVALHDGTIDVLSLNTTKSSQCPLFRIDPKIIFSYKSIDFSTLALKVSTLLWSFCGQSLCIGWFIGGFIVVSSTGSIIYVKPTLSQTYNQMLSQISSRWVFAESPQELNQNTQKETCSFLNETTKISSDTPPLMNSVSKPVSSLFDKAPVFENQENYVLTATWTFAGLSLLLIHSSFPNLVSEIAFYRTSPLCLPHKESDFFGNFPNHFYSARLLIGSEKLLLHQSTQRCDGSKPYLDIPLSKHDAMKNNWPIQQAVESPDQKYILCVGKKKLMLYSLCLNQWSFWKNENSKTYLRINSLPVGWYTSSIFFVCSNNANNLTSTSVLPWFDNMHLFTVKKKSVYDSIKLTGSTTSCETTINDTYSVYFFHVYYPLQNKRILASINDLKNKPIFIHTISPTDTNLRPTIEFQKPHSIYTESSSILLYNPLEPRKHYLDFQKSASMNKNNHSSFKPPPTENCHCALVIYDSSYQLTAYTLIIPSSCHTSLKTTPLEETIWMIERLWTVDLSSSHWIAHPLRLQFIGTYHILVLHPDLHLTLIRIYELPLKTEETQLQTIADAYVFNQLETLKNSENFQMHSEKLYKSLKIFKFEESQVLLENVFNFWATSETQFSYFFPLSSPSISIFSTNIDKPTIQASRGRTPGNLISKNERKPSHNTLAKNVSEKNEQHEFILVNNTFHQDELLASLQLTKDNNTTGYKVICGSYIWCETVDSYYLISVSQLRRMNSYEEKNLVAPQGIYDYKVTNIMKKKSSFKTPWFTTNVNGNKGSICECVTISTPLLGPSSLNHCKYSICFSQIFEQRRFMAHYIVYKILRVTPVDEISQHRYNLACSFCDMMEGTSQFSSFLETLLFHVLDTVSEIFTHEMKLIETNPSSGASQLLKETASFDLSSGFLLQEVPFRHLHIKPSYQMNPQFSNQKVSHYIISLSCIQEEKNFLEDNLNNQPTFLTHFPDLHTTMSYSLLAEDYVYNKIHESFINECHFEKNTFTPPVCFVLLLLKKLYQHNSHVQLFVTLLQLVKRYTLWFPYIIISLIRKSCSTLLPLILFPLSGITLESLYNACVVRKQYQVAALYLVIFQNCFGTLQVRRRFVLPLFTLVLKHHQYFLAKKLLIFFMAAYSLPHVQKDYKDTNDIAKEGSFFFFSRQLTCRNITREVATIHYPRTFGPKELYPQFHNDSFYNKNIVNNLSYQETALVSLLTFREFEVNIIKSLLSSIVHFQWFQFLTHIYLLQLDILPWLTVIKETLQDYFREIEDRVLGEFEQKHHDLSLNLEENKDSKVITGSCSFLSLIQSFQKQFICDFVKINPAHHQKITENLVGSLEFMSSTQGNLISECESDKDNDSVKNQFSNSKDIQTTFEDEIRQIIKPLFSKLLPYASNESNGSFPQPYTESTSPCQSLSEKCISRALDLFSDSNPCSSISLTEQLDGVKKSSVSFEKLNKLIFANDPIPSGSHVSHKESQIFLQFLVSIFMALDIYCIPLAICFSISDINFLNYLYTLNPKCKLVAVQFMCTRGHQFQ